MEFVAGYSHLGTLRLEILARYDQKIISKINIQDNELGVINQSTFLFYDIFTQ